MIDLHGKAIFKGSYIRDNRKCGKMFKFVAQDIEKKYIILKDDDDNFTVRSREEFEGRTATSFGSFPHYCRSEHVMIMGGKNVSVSLDDIAKAIELFTIRLPDVIVLEGSCCIFENVKHYCENNNIKYYTLKNVTDPYNQQDYRKYVSRFVDKLIIVDENKGYNFWIDSMERCKTEVSVYELDCNSTKGCKLGEIPKRNQ